MLIFIKNFNAFCVDLKKKSLPIPSLWIYSLMFFSTSFIILPFMSKSLTYFNFSFVYDVVGGKESVCSHGDI